MITLALRRPLIWALMFAGSVAAPAVSPGVPAVATVIQVGPDVRAIVRGLNQVDVPPQWRRKNWTNREGKGSCVHASIVTLMHWQGRSDLATWWQSQYSGPDDENGLAVKLDAAGVSFAETRSGDVSFLDWSIRTRRGAAVVVHGREHMVCLVGLDSIHAHILDSNSPNTVQHWPREDFVRDWRASRGWAVTIVGTPPPVTPWIVRDSNKFRMRM